MAYLKKLKQKLFQQIFETSYVVENHSVSIPSIVA